ncbi:hypothetical protein TTHERM_00237650 (macronuclear) [Tetrahymena thermophila SB210]|uniref:Uncharacterized protein n=1 Tax=Tetrahymena thermophila (strain SB210) TaxID=312017 RepID=I7MIL4_TETTS|nr:hypothetical protein TTHERM_00237650 [Tetrahymena thermophila SB210]EAS04550.2 hypothetical protein TTHERM_00237650 [Tetrahymena thermophila SB210]|eukprot:XP_001024795.2 hypothetical protein TTHERM_00237650 [Tetrahymena thermophila SB210]
MLLEIQSSSLNNSSQQCIENSQQPLNTQKIEDLDIENAVYLQKQDYSTLKDLKKHISTPFLHCPQVTFRYTQGQEGLELTTYLKEIKNNIQCFENIIFVIKFSKSIDECKQKYHKTIIGGYQNEFMIECNIKTKKIKLILDYLTQFTYIEDVMIQKYALQQSKFKNLEGIHLQKELFQNLYLIKQISKFNTVEFAVSQAFLPMNFYKILDVWRDLRVLVISCEKSKITIDNLKKIMQIKLFNPQRELTKMIQPILGENISENYQKIIICDFPFNQDELGGLENIKNIIKLKIDLDVDFKIQPYSPIELFKYLSTQKNMNSLYFRCLPYPPTQRLSQQDFGNICTQIIKIKSLTNLYLDMNFNNIQIERINRLEFKINQKQVYVKFLKLLKEKFPKLHQTRWEVKFELINMFLTEKMRELKTTLPVSDKNSRKNPIYSEYFCKF